MDAAVPPLPPGWAAPGPPSARPALTSPFAHPPPYPHPRVSRLSRRPNQPVTALSSSRRCWGKGLAAAAGTAGGSGVPRPSATRRRKPDGPTLIELASCLPSSALGSYRALTPGGRARRRRRGPGKSVSVRQEPGQLQGYFTLHLRPGRSAKLVSAPSLNSKRAMSLTRGCLCPCGTEKGREPLIVSGREREIKFQRPPRDRRLEE